MAYVYIEAHALLLNYLESDVVAERVAALNVLPEVAILKSDELFDWLSVLLDDDHVDVEKQPVVVTTTSPVFPSGVHSILANELRSTVQYRSDAAGLD